MERFLKLTSDFHMHSHSLTHIHIYRTEKTTTASTKKLKLGRWLSIKCSYRHEDLGSDRQHLHKSLSWLGTALILALRNGDRKIQRTHWLANMAKTMKFQNQRDPYSKVRWRRMKQDILTSAYDLYMCPCW